MNAAVEYAQSVKVIAKNLAGNSDDTNLRQKDTIQKQERVYGNKEDDNQATRSRFEVLQQPDTGIVRMKVLMSSLEDEDEIQCYFDHGGRELWY